MSVIRSEIIVSNAGVVSIIRRSNIRYEQFTFPLEKAILQPSLYNFVFGAGLQLNVLATPRKRHFTSAFCPAEKTGSCRLVGRCLGQRRVTVDLRLDCNSVTEDSLSGLEKLGWMLSSVHDWLEYSQLTTSVAPLWVEVVTSLLLAMQLNTPMSAFDTLKTVRNEVAVFSSARPLNVVRVRAMSKPSRSQ